MDHLLVTTGPSTAHFASSGAGWEDLADNRGLNHIPPGHKDRVKFGLGITEVRFHQAVTVSEYRG